MAKKDSDEALFEDALKKIDTAEYGTAVEKILSTSAAFQAKTEVKEALAAAYAGKCGLDFATYSTALGSASLTGSTFFKYLMNTVKTISVSEADCKSAETAIKSIGATALERSSGQNFFMAFLSMFKIGAYLKTSADTNADGEADNGDTCALLSDDQVTEVITGFSLLLENLTAVTSALSGDASSTLTTLQAGCALMTPNPCSKIDASGVVAGDIDSMKDLLRTAVANPTLAAGIGDCVDPTVAPCCP